MTLTQTLSLTALAFAAATTSHATAAFDVYAQANSSSGGSGVSTIALVAGQPFSVSVNPGDLWNAGPLPRWSNADGLTSDLYATGTDDSLQSFGTHIGAPFSSWTQDGFTAPFGSLVGVIGGAHVLLGTSYSGLAPASGTLELFYWDSNNYDNSEKISAQVGTGVPDTSSAMSLLASAILVLGSARRLLV